MDGACTLEFTLPNLPFSVFVAAISLRCCKGGVPKNGHCVAGFKGQTRVPLIDTLQKQRVHLVQGGSGATWMAQNNDLATTDPYVLFSPC